MNKIRRILAICGIILLAGMYVLTLVFALIDSADSMLLFKASILTTVLVPVLLWAYSFVFRLLKDNSPVRREEEPEEKDRGSKTE